MYKINVLNTHYDRGLSPNPIQEFEEELLELKK